MGLVERVSCGFQRGREVVKIGQYPDDVPFSLRFCVVYGLCAYKKLTMQLNRQRKLSV